MYVGKNIFTINNSHLLQAVPPSSMDKYLVINYLFWNIMVQN